MYTILMPIDTDEQRVLAQTRAITDLPGDPHETTVYLLHIFDDEERADSTSPRQIATGREAYDRLQSAGIGVESLSRFGDAATEILRAADEVGADHVVLGGRKRSPLGTLLFGSVSQSVMLDASRPVTVTGGIEQQGQPTHRCADCGEEYYADPDVDIATCRNCGGTTVEAMTQEA